MKTPVRDYRKLRINNINSKEYSHLKLLLSWVVYFIMFFLTEKFIPEEACHIVHCRLDDLIPFNEFFIIFYISWYFLIVGSLVYMLLYDIEGFKKMQTFIIITQIVAVVIYIVWPSVQYGRPVSFENSNLLTKLTALIYSVDTPTGVCPSLHVGYSIAIASTWAKKRDISLYKRVLIIIWATLICMSVAFVKQHSVVDILAAIPMCIFAEFILFGKSYWRPRLEKTVRRKDLINE